MSEPSPITQRKLDSRALKWTGAASRRDKRRALTAVVLVLTAISVRALALALLSSLPHAHPRSALLERPCDLGDRQECVELAHQSVSGLIWEFSDHRRLQAAS